MKRIVRRTLRHSSESWNLPVFKGRWIPAFAGMTLVGMVALQSSPVIAAELQPLRTITVNGMAKRQVVPDEAHLTVNLNSMEPKLADAKAAHDKKLKKLMGIVKDAGIDEKKMRTQSSNMQPVYHYENDAKGKNVRKFDGYRVQTNLDITVGDTSKLGALMDSVTGAGFEQGANTEWGDLTSVYYSLSNPDKIRDEMLVEALDNAKDKAEKLAGAAGSSIARVYQIQESGTPTFEFLRPVMMRTKGVMSMAAEAAPMAPPAGEQEVNANVTVMYELKD